MSQTLIARQQSVLLTVLCLTFHSIRCEDSYTNKDGSIYTPKTTFKNIIESVDKSNYVVYEESNLDHDDIPILLWWTPNLYPYIAVDKKWIVIQCGEAVCYSTKRRELLHHEQTRGILFYATDISVADLPLRRTEKHEWAVFHEESPFNLYMLSHSPFMSLFNHTATFRRESDFPLTTQNIYTAEFLTEKLPIPLATKNEAKTKTGLAPILYVQSHCDVPSDRDRYIKELMKYIKIDSYGVCLHNKDLPEHLQEPAENFEKDEFLELISIYKFHLAFENAICKDYMTEKLMRPLHIGVVPIYKGSPNAKDWMPNNHSIILVDDFETPKQLAEFIDYLDKNDEEYKKYISFKQTGITNEFLLNHLSQRNWEVNEQDSMDYFKGFECHVCKKLNERMEAERAHSNNPSVPLVPPRMANNSHLGCPQPYPSLGDVTDILKNDSWNQMAWVDDYWISS
ncbi:alpha-(1,3)-fucosyltransferase 11-like isoform X2 [Gigantopelta aegis]|uniref:alpha-(1,3)-fucosyltransferase 11-like isoform X2 n=1 Tax=Gigantopelta aegis TaxID=1735272 RepID=UPI001B887AC3|nr:alpha-(1,3)-fucosyltransferase 11-like isoform X2 [Gigantopelta aegis]